MTIIGMWLIQWAVVVVALGSGSQPDTASKPILVERRIEPPGWPWRIGAIVLATGTGAIIVWLVGFEGVQAVSAVALGTAAVTAWAATEPDVVEPGSAKALLAGVTIVACAAVASAELWDQPSLSPIQGWLDRSPILRPYDIAASTACLTVGAVLALVWPANRLVHLTLKAAEADGGGLVGRIKGGRFIGPIERLIIFALAMAGEPAAAALVISAKGLLRYPELQDLRRSKSDPNSDSDPGARIEPVSAPTLNRKGDDIHTVTEYLLIGSLTSIALAFVVVFLVETARG